MGERARFPQPGPFSPLEIPGYPPHTHKRTKDRSVGGGTTGVLYNGKVEGQRVWEKGVGKVVQKDRDVSQKSEQGNRGAADALANELWPRSGASCQDKDSHLVSVPTLAPNSSAPFSPEPCTSPVRGPGVSLKSKGPSTGSSALKPTQHPPPICRRGPGGSPGGGGRPCPPPRAAGAPGAAGWGRRPWRGAQDWAIAATCGTARRD